MGWTYTTRTKGYSAPAGPISGFFMVLLGIALLAGAAYTGKSTHELVTQGAHVEGRVAEVKEEWDTTTKHRNGYSEKVTKKKYRFIVDFRDGKGNAIRFKDSQTADYQAHNKGDTVPVLYLERAPQETATIDHGMMNWLLPGILGLMGFVFAGSGAFAMLRGSKPRAPG